jgi:hypothetical protein
VSGIPDILTISTIPAENERLLQISEGFGLSDDLNDNGQPRVLKHPETGLTTFRAWSAPIMANKIISLVLLSALLVGCGSLNPLNPPAVHAQAATPAGCDAQWGMHGEYHPFLGILPIQHLSDGKDLCRGVGNRHQFHAEGRERFSLLLAVRFGRWANQKHPRKHKLHPLDKQREQHVCGYPRLHV